jgi:hypothetical protein
VSKYQVRVGTAWRLTRGSGAGAPAPIPPVFTPASGDFNSSGVALDDPVFTTNAGGRFSLAARLATNRSVTFNQLLMNITDPSGVRHDAGFAQNVTVASTQRLVQALEQVASATGTWTARIAYSLDGTNFSYGPSTTFTISSLT